MKKIFLLIGVMFFYMNAFAWNQGWIKNSSVYQGSSSVLNIASGTINNLYGNGSGLTGISGGTAGGDSNQIQINYGDTFVGDSDLTWSSGTKTFAMNLHGIPTPIGTFRVYSSGGNLLYASALTDSVFSIHYISPNFTLSDRNMVDKAYLLYNTSASYSASDKGSIQIKTVIDETNSGYVCLVNNTGSSLETREIKANTTDPVLRVYSSDTAEANDYIDMYHNQTDGIIKSGNGNISILSSETIKSNGTNNDFSIDTTSATFYDTVYFSSAVICYSRTEEQLKALSPASVGALYYDSTNKAIVLSTGTSAGQFSTIQGGSAPLGW